MKTLLTLITSLFAFSAFAQGPVLRTPYTVNTADFVTNIVRNIGTNSTIHAGKLAPGGTLPALNGSALTSLNGTAIASGTVADARLSSNIPKKDAVNVFSASNYISAGMFGDLTVQNNIVGQGNISLNGLLGDPNFATVSLDTSTGDFLTAGSIYLTSGAEMIFGNGGGLSNLPSASLVGALPAIDGSQLTGITGGSGISLGAVAGYVNTNAVSKVRGHITQPWTLTNTLVFVVSDSFGYYWPGAFTNMYHWGGSGSPTPLLGFTNGNEGGTSIIDHTNNLETRIIPWLQTFSTNADVIALWAGGTIDQINGIALVGGVTNFNSIISNASVRLKGLGFHSMTFVRPSLIQCQNLGEADGATDASNDPMWNHNNWLVSTSTNVVDFVPDFFRRLNNNRDPRFFIPDGHPNETNGAALMAEEVDEQLRGLRGRPTAYTAELIQNRWEWRNTTNNALAAKLWQGGAWQHLRASYDGTFPASKINEQIGIQAVGFGTNGHAFDFMGRSNQNTYIGGISAWNSPAHIQFWDAQLYDISLLITGGRAIFDGGMRLGHARTLEFTNANNRRFDFILGSDGRLTYRDTLDQSLLGPSTELFIINPSFLPARPRISTPGHFAQTQGYWRPNISSKVVDTAVTDHDTDVIRVEAASTMTLPTAVGFKGKPFTIINMSLTTTATVARASSQLIGGSNANFTLGAGESLSVLSDDTNWVITAWYSPSAKYSSGSSSGGTTNVVNDGNSVVVTDPDGTTRLDALAASTKINNDAGTTILEGQSSGNGDTTIGSHGGTAQIGLSDAAGGTITLTGNMSIDEITATAIIGATSSIKTNTAAFDVDITAFVVGTRYTNSTRRSFVTASFTLNGAAAGTAAVTLSAEQAGVTNMVKISAGPLASLSTIEQLSLLVGPGAFYYFTDATTGTGASVAIVTGTSSRTDW